MFRPRQWVFVEDMDGDGVVYFLLNIFPEWGHFLEITYDNYGGVLSGIISFFVWGFLCLTYIKIKEDFPDWWNKKIRKLGIDDTDQDL